MNTTSYIKIYGSDSDVSTKYQISLNSVSCTVPFRIISDKDIDSYNDIKFEPNKNNKNTDEIKQQAVKLTSKFTVSNGLITSFGEYKTVHKIDFKLRLLCLQIFGNAEVTIIDDIFSPGYAIIYMNDKSKLTTLCDNISVSKFEIKSSGKSEVSVNNVNTELLIVESSNESKVLLKQIRCKLNYFSRLHIKGHDSSNITVDDAEGDTFDFKYEGNTKYEHKGLTFKYINDVKC
jgi:hypothetical protein